jgi:hypothetical protein
MQTTQQRLALPCTECGQPACSVVIPEIPDAVRNMASALANVAKIQARFSFSAPSSGPALPNNPLDLLSENPDVVSGVLQLRCSSCA